LAASVVREYLLPMFESDGKRLLKMKNKKSIAKLTPLSPDTSGNQISF